MSSAAAAAANIGVPAEGQNGTMQMGGVTSLVQSADDPIPNRIPAVEPLDSDNESDIGVKASKRRERRQVLEEDDQDGHLENGQELFGDEDDHNEVEKAARKPRQLDDEELDSGDDAGRNDRVQSDEPAEEAEVETAQLLVEEPCFARRPLPQPSDGEMYLLKIPKFMAIEPQMFHTPSFQVPTTEHHSRKEPSATFSAYNTAMSTLRWRHSPSKPEELQSNARVLRWSDGSLTLQFGSDPSQQYEMDGKPLAPPQKRPSKPTPVSFNKTGMGANRETKIADSYTYLSVPEANVGLLRVVNKITAGLSILPSASTKDDAEERLKASLAAAAAERSGGMARSGITLLKTHKDPERQRMEAEVAERQKARQQKNMERAAERMNNGPGSRRGAGRASMGGGLTTGMLEDDEQGGRPRSKPKSRRRTYNDEYSEDEDNGRRKANFASEEYEKDDFVAASDEEEEEEEDAEESDPDEGLGDVASSKPKAKGDSPKRPRADEDADAEGEEDEEGVQAPKRKARRVIAEDDEEE